MGPTLQKKRASLYPLLRDQPDKPGKANVYAWGTLGTRGLRVCGGMEEVELLALNFKCTLRRGSFLTSQFSFMKCIFHEGNTTFSGEPGGVGH